MHGQLMYPIDVFHFVQEKFKIAWNENEINKPLFFWGMFFRKNVCR